MLSKPRVGTVRSFSLGILGRFGAELTKKKVAQYSISKSVVREQRRVEAVYSVDIQVLR